MLNKSTLHINNLDLLVNLGWSDKEREEKQMVRATLEIQFPAPPKACTTDQLEDTFCYSDMIEKIFLHIQDKQYHMIEHLSQEIYTILKFILGSDKKVTVSITKHPSIKNFAGDVCFSYGD